MFLFIPQTVINHFEQAGCIAVIGVKSVCFFRQFGGLRVAEDLYGAVESKKKAISWRWAAEPVLWHAVYQKKKTAKLLGSTSQNG